MTIDPRELGAIFAGGGAGALARVGLSQAFPSGPASWPWATFTVNVSGALLLGYLITHLSERPQASSYRRPLAATGFCGAYTTFSTMQLELLQMLDHRRYALAVGYGVASVVCGYLAVHVATAVTRRASFAT